MSEYHDLDATYVDLALAYLDEYLGPNGALARYLASKDSLRLTRLPRFLPLIAASFFFFTLIHVLVAPLGSRLLAPRTYDGLRGRRGRNAWNVHIVSMVHALMIVPLALLCLDSPALAADRVFGWDYDAAVAHSVAVGYFLWDTTDSIVNFVDLGFVAHGLACLLVYGLSYRPFVLYFGVRCLLWEISTVFLNINWFLDKLGKTGSIAQMVNGGFLLASFFGVRIIYGGMVSFQFLAELYAIRHEASTLVCVIYGGGNIVLQGLNWFWFYKMIQALQKRFRTGNMPAVPDAPSKAILTDDSVSKEKKA
ncbi:TLC domain-containing protein [Schizophyllum amplum]|uniref:TLC domain-containing protein n=1 Tax=Schizophyllum amplum TaxID=97359 RepID=A0A550CCM7_9AGAR|nr:TLC domain-containing protein [Auriculariopsis ampla]